MRNKKVGLNGFATLSDETRLKIFLKIVELSASSFINDDPVLAQNTAKHITEVFGLAKSTVSHHIEALKNSGLIFEVKKKKFIYLFPNFAAITDFKTFLDEQVLAYQTLGQYECAANLSLSRIQDVTLSTLKDFLIVQGCKNVTNTKDVAGNTKIYFKITGFNEPFYMTISGTSARIFCIQKNYASAKDSIAMLSEMLVRSFQ